MIMLMINYMIYSMITIYLVFSIINKLNNKKKNIESFMSIECGFNYINNKHIPMYLNFFIIFMIFMIFDLEFFLIVPLIILIKSMNWIKMLFMMITSFLFIYFSLMYEIKFNSIKWIK
uniref:NADH dehydrogenase subunit 3 n=1 Tax=Phenacoccus manihoti TaxID=483259 RepID=UPI0021CD1063|nr:NADH dehydrogenase subunit 3 [Phenacoccus manihoti]UWM93458.1 NADH dehydrogenase subunit 3 [Phenacoccus manihoti]